jgi:hypothetical protein
MIRTCRAFGLGMNQIRVSLRRLLQQGLAFFAEDLAFVAQGGTGSPEEGLIYRRFLLAKTRRRAAGGHSFVDTRASFVRVPRPFLGIYLAKLD